MFHWVLGHRDPSFSCPVVCCVFGNKIYRLSDICTLSGTAGQSGCYFYSEVK